MQAEKNRNCFTQVSLVIVTCTHHQLAPGVDPQDNRGIVKMHGKSWLFNPLVIFSAGNYPHPSLNNANFPTPIIDSETNSWICPYPPGGWLQGQTDDMWLIWHKRGFSFTIRGKSYLICHWLAWTGVDSMRNFTMIMNWTWSLIT